MDNYFESPIFILGLPRSGTSLITGSLNICGAWTGTTFPGNSDNPKGFFEHIVLREMVTKTILKRLGCDPLGVKKLPPIDYTVKNSNLKSIVYRILKEDGYNNDMPWIYKCPKLSLIWRFFWDAFPKSKWIVVKRNKQDIINSLLRTKFMNRHSTNHIFWENFIKEYNLRINKLKTSLTNFREINSVDIVEKNYTDFIDIIDWLGLTFKNKAIEQFISKSHFNI
jgi:hypothetical protein